MSKIKMRHISKQFNKKSDQKIIDDFNLEIKEKEFIVFVGPSGCGKSTTLRMIAGLESITDGELWIDNKLVNDLPPKDRDIAMVFQNYALFPHLTVYDNIAFGLKIRKIKKSNINERVYTTAKTLGLLDYLKRKPKDLSGGQRQRVSLGRVIVRDANIFLMDEPLSNLDARLRVQMRKEIINLHEKLGTTTIYVTHDQTEAMTMASRIVVLNDGIIQQIGTPDQVYSRPNNMFVASFIGSPSMNFIKGKLSNNILSLFSGEKLFTFKKHIDHEGDVMIGIRPEDTILTNEGQGIKMHVDFIEMMGSDLHVHGKVEDSKVIIRVNSDENIKVNDQIFIEFLENKIHLFDPTTELSLYNSYKGKEMRE